MKQIIPDTKKTTTNKWCGFIGVPNVQSMKKVARVARIARLQILNVQNHVRLMIAIMPCWQGL
jgi:hypothetical protein